MDESNKKIAESYNSLPEALKHDCKECQSMCCVALKIDWDGVIKDQNVPCEYLSEDFTCLAWDRLKEVGRESCLTFYCLNTGPSICRPVFEAKTDWRRTPEIAELLFNEFRKLYISTFKNVTGIDPEIKK
jgi:hypothetical protein